MKLRHLVIDDTARAKIAAVIAHAEKNHYEHGAPLACYDPRYVAELNTYRAVFTFTKTDGKLFRHLSVSVPGDKYPNPVAVFTIAHEFGFTGYDHNQADRPGEGWMIDLDHPAGAVVILQLITPATSRAWLQ